MLAKISIGLNMVLLVLAVLIFVHANGMKTAMDTLSRRVTDLEVQNVQLSRQLVQLDRNAIPVARRGAAAGQATSPERMARSIRRSGEPFSDTETGGDAVNLGELKADLRREVESMVAQEQTDLREKRREEWQQRMAEGIKQSLSEFAEDHQVDDRVVEQISALFDESTARRQQLREDLDARNMSFYEFRQEERKIRDEMNAKMAELLTEDQMAAFEDTFPIGPGLGGRGRGRRP
jgi:phage-related protein